MPVRPPSLRAVSAFEAAARHESFSKASDELNVTHGAISHAVRALEERLGQRLFERRGRGVALTEAGRILAGRIRLGIGLLSQAFDTSPWLQKSRLVISCLPSFACRFLVPRLQQFRVAHPKIDLEIRASGMLVAIGVDGVDIGLRYGPGRWAGLASLKLYYEQLFPVSSPHVAAGLPKHPREICDDILIGHPELSWRQWFAAAGADRPEPACPLVLDEAMSVLDAAAAGAGIALARSLLAEPDLKAGRLVRLYETEIRSDYAYWLVWNPVSPKLDAIRAFGSWLQSELEAVKEMAVVSNAQLSRQPI